jgi:AcrR family transcriptional regulator
MSEPSAPLSGRRAQAAVNDQRILQAARAVFIEDPGAPIATVAKRAGVGISALYSRYPSKEDLLRKLCGEGLERFISLTEAALADERDPWIAFEDFMRQAVDANTNSLTGALAGTFSPTEELWRRGAYANELLVALFRRTHEAGVLREDLDVHDISLIFEQLAAVRGGDEERTVQLRRRYLALILEALRTSGGQPLPGPPPSWEEVNERWAG